MAASLVVSCEHASNALPPRFRAHFADARSVLDSHRGVDIGAAHVARALARRFDIKPHLARFSRLLVELNRSPHHPKLWSEWSRRLTPTDRDQILSTIYVPYRDAVEKTITRQLRRSTRVIHISVHSFTPELDGHFRNADIGLLYDSRRALERKFADRWRTIILALDPSLRVRRNYPYRGDADGFTTYLRTRFDAKRYLGLELELNQAMFAQRPLPSPARHAIFAVSELFAERI